MLPNKFQFYCLKDHKTLYTAIKDCADYRIEWDNMGELHESYYSPEDAQYAINTGHWKVIDKWDKLKERMCSK